MCPPPHRAAEEKKKNANTANKRMRLQGRGGSALHTSGLCRPRGDTADDGSSRRVTRRCTSHRVKKESLAARDAERDDGSGTSTPAASVSLRELVNAQWDPQGRFFINAVAAVWSRQSRRSLHLDSRATRRKGRARLSVFAGLLLFLLGFGLRPGITEFVKSHIGFCRWNNFTGF